MKTFKAVQGSIAGYFLNDKKERKAKKMKASGPTQASPQ